MEDGPGFATSRWSATRGGRKRNEPRVSSRLPITLNNAHFPVTPFNNCCRKLRNFSDWRRSAHDYRTLHDDTRILPAQGAAPIPRDASVKVIVPSLEVSPHFRANTTTPITRIRPSGRDFATTSRQYRTVNRLRILATV